MKSQNEKKGGENMGFFSRKISVNYEIKRVVDSMLSTARSLSPKIEEDAKNDLLLFLLKQTAADGQVAKEEVQFINEYLGMNGTVSGVRNYLNKYAYNHLISLYY